MGPFSALPNPGYNGMRFHSVAGPGALGWGLAAAAHEKLGEALLSSTAEQEPGAGDVPGCRVPAGCDFPAVGSAMGAVPRPPRRGWLGAG